MGDSADGVISARRFGAAEVTLLSAGRIFEEAPRFPADRDWRSSANVDARGRVVHGLGSALIRIGDAVVLVDPAFFESAEEAAGYFDGELAQTAEQALARVGLEPGDVTHVVVTHAHRDHYWAALTQRDGAPAARFANAEHLIPAADWELPFPGALLGLASGDRFDGLSEADFVARFHRYLDPVRAAGRLRLVEGDHEVCPGVTLEHTGGETEGHMVVRVEDGGATFVYLGDLIHFPVECGELDIGPTRLGPGQLAQLADARRRVFSAAVEHDATLVYTHAAFPGWGRVEPDGAGAWRWCWT